MQLLSSKNLRVKRRATFHSLPKPNALEKHLDALFLSSHRRLLDIQIIEILDVPFQFLLIRSSPFLRGMFSFKHYKGGHLINFKVEGCIRIVIHVDFAKGHIRIPVENV